MSRIPVNELQHARTIRCPSCKLVLRVSAAQIDLPDPLSETKLTGAISPRDRVSTPSRRSQSGVDGVPPVSVPGYEVLKRNKSPADSRFQAFSDVLED